jgi:hypothetical protein
MDNSVRQQESDVQQSSHFLISSLHVFSGILQRLAGLIQLTEDEQRDAGVYFPGEQPNDNERLDE